MTKAGGQVGDRLELLHRSWLQDLRAVLGKVGRGDCDVWPRWNAIRYIEAVFSGRFDRERAVIEKLSDAFGEKQVARLWVAGELVATVRWQLCHSVALCHHPGEFSTITRRLLRAVEHWFREVEEIAGPLSWAALPMQTRKDLASDEPMMGDTPCRRQA